MVKLKPEHRMDEWLLNFRHLAITASVCFGALALTLILIAADRRFNNLPLVFFLCGANGAVVANYRRLSLLVDDAEEVRKALATPPVIIQLYVSPIIGGIFALILWSAFLGGLINGALFPKITGFGSAFHNLHDLMSQTGPETFADAMKGIFWSFLAGYSERFVPNAVDRLAAKAGAR